MESPKHKRRSSEQSQDMVRQYHESGLRAKEFCELNSLVLGTFRGTYWDRRWLKLLCGKDSVSLKRDDQFMKPLPTGSAPVPVLLFNLRWLSHNPSSHG